MDRKVDSVGKAGNREKLLGRVISTLAGAALLLGTVVACGPDGGEERVPLGGSQSAPADAVADLPGPLQALLDSANAAYRSRDYQGALGYFSELTREAPGLAAGWYGVGMTHSAMGNHEEAEEAMMEVHRLAPELPLQHPGTTAPPNPHASPPVSGGERDGPPDPHAY
jgi:tetratricopeptide (TPR) repeat protein